MKRLSSTHIKHSWEQNQHCKRGYRLLEVSKWSWRVLELVLSAAFSKARPKKLRVERKRWELRRLGIFIVYNKKNTLQLKMSIGRIWITNNSGNQLKVPVISPSSLRTSLKHTPCLLYTNTTSKQSKVLFLQKLKLKGPKCWIELLV